MAADLLACQVLVTPAAEFYRTDRGSHWIYCQEIVHQVGHLAGLTHDYGGVLAQHPAVIPWGCEHPRRWAQLKEWRRTLPPR